MSVRYDNCRLELLADAKGTYGVALVGEDHPTGWDDTRLVLRPDKVNEYLTLRSLSPVLSSILQPVPRHLQRSFRHTSKVHRLAWGFLSPVADDRPNLYYKRKNGPREPTR